MLADELDLRGYDAVHLAACERIADDDTALVTGDRRMADAAGMLGLATSLLPSSPSAQAPRLQWAHVEVEGLTVLHV